MAGSATQRSASLWAGFAGLAEIERRDAWFEYQATGAAPSDPWHSTSTVTLDRAVNVLTHRIYGLEAGTEYRYRLAWRNRGKAEHTGEYRFRTAAFWQFRSDPPPLRILAGSCAYTNDSASDRPGKPYGQDPWIFGAMAARQPDITLWMGDNIYFREPDFDDPTMMANRYDQWRALPEMQGLLHVGQHLAIWDDHDFGTNDSNSSSISKQDALTLFRRYWANPSYGQPGQPGVFTRYANSDVEFFLLDNRWYRDSDELRDTDRHMFGAEQLRWLKNALLSSTATFKLIVSGSQMINSHDRYEGWNMFPTEQGDFLDWLAGQRVPGVMLLSGDRHFSMMLEQARPGTYPLRELTCSPLTANPFSDPSAELRGNARVVAGSVVTRNSFCELQVSGVRGKRELHLAIHGADGATIWSKQLGEQDFRSR